MFQFYSRGHATIGQSAVMNFPSSVPAYANTLKITSCLHCGRRWKVRALGHGPGLVSAQVSKSWAIIPALYSELGPGSSLGTQAPET